MIDYRITKPGLHRLHVEAAYRVLKEMENAIASFEEMGLVDATIAAGQINMERSRLIQRDTAYQDASWMLTAGVHPSKIYGEPPADPVDGCNAHVEAAEPEGNDRERRPKFEGKVAMTGREHPTLRTKFIDVLFDGPPGHESGRFVEVEDDRRRSISFGEWLEDVKQGYWRLRFPVANVVD